MNLLDLGLLALAVGAAIGGWRLGLITRALSWAGMALGIIGAARILPAVVTAPTTAPAAPSLVALAVGRSWAARSSARPWACSSATG